MKLKLVIDSLELRGQKLPRWYGEAYMDFYTGRVTLLVIPLNIPVRYGHTVWSSVLHWLKRAAWENELTGAHSKGLAAGIQEGRARERFRIVLEARAHSLTDSDALQWFWKFVNSGKE